MPGSSTTLERLRAEGADVRIVYSTLEAVELARALTARRIVFLGIGFETTAPASAAAVATAHAQGLRNFFLLSSHKIMPPAMAAIVQGGTALDGFLCPGHVTMVTGSGIYDFLAREHGKACVVAGFEPADLLLSILMLVRQLERGEPCVEIEYSRAVRPEGNSKARALLEHVFVPVDDWWRGLGTIPASGLGLAPAYAEHDASQIPVEVERLREPAGCRCGEVLKGQLEPPDCPLYGKGCTPADPVGACMVSSEGACAAWYRYARTR